MKGSNIGIILFALLLPAIAIASEVPQVGWHPWAALLAYQIGFPASLAIGWVLYSTASAILKPDRRQP